MVQVIYPLAQNRTCERALLQKDQVWGRLERSQSYFLLGVIQGSQPGKKGTLEKSKVCFSGETGTCISEHRKPFDKQKFQTETEQDSCCLLMEAESWDRRRREVFYWEAALPKISSAQIAPWFLWCGQTQKYPVAVYEIQAVFLSSLVERCITEMPREFYEAELNCPKAEQLLFPSHSSKPKK